MINTFLKNKKFKIGPNDFLRKKRSVFLAVQKTLNKYNRIYGFKYNRITIKNQKSRWGSCSSKKNLNFNYRLFYLPESLFEYIVVHELCHLKEMNHSHRFWSLVEKTVPDYKSRRKRLRDFNKLF